MKFPDDPRLPFDLPGLVRRLTDLLRQLAPIVNGHEDKLATPIEPAAAVTLGASPAAVSATTDGLLVVRGGTVSLMEYGRRGAWTTLGITAGLVPLKAGDVVRITYTAAPTVTMVPQ